MFNYKLEMIEKKYGEILSFGEADRLMSESEGPLISKLAERGLFILDVWSSLANPAPEIAAVLPRVADILIAAVDDDYHPQIISGIIRTLGNKSIVDNFDLYDFLKERALVAAPSSQILNPKCRGCEQSFFYSLSQHFKIEKLDDYLSVMLNESLSDSRCLLLLAFEKHHKNEKIREILKNLCDHPLFGYMATKICKKKKIL